MAEARIEHQQYIYLVYLIFDQKLMLQKGIRKNTIYQGTIAEVKLNVSQVDYSKLIASL